MSFEGFWGTAGSFAGLVVALALFLGAAWLVARARRGNRRVREARHDPHAVPDQSNNNTHRDISQ